VNALEKLANPAYALMRIVTGSMFCFHGVQKILGLFSQSQPAFGTQMWFGGIIELFGGLAVMLGFQTRTAAFLCSGMMAVAYIQFKWKFQLGAMLFPAINQGELAALYSVVFLLIACRGAGKWGLEKG